MPFSDSFIYFHQGLNFCYLLNGFSFKMKENHYTQVTQTILICILTYEV